MTNPDAPIRRFHTFRKTGIALGMVMIMAAPAPAFAFQSLMQIAATKAAEFMQVLAKEAAMLAQWTYDKTQNLLTQRSGTESIVGAIEKQIAGNKELTQAQLNYEAANSSRLRFQSAQDNFTSESSKSFQTCETIKNASVSVGSIGETKELVRHDGRVAAKRGLHTENSSVVARQVLTDYKNKYCSVEDVKRGFCETAAPALMQGASWRASTLLTPAAGETYTTDEADAAADYITMVTGPVPNEMLPKGTEKKIGAAQMFNLTMMSAEAQMSIASHSLNQIRASRSAESELSENAAGLNDVNLSTVGLMKRFAEKRFSDPKYQEGLSGMLTPALLQEFTLQMAARNWMDYQTYQQDERIEALIATRLSLLAGERNARQLALARSFVKAH